MTVDTNDSGREVRSILRMNLPETFVPCVEFGGRLAGFSDASASFLPILAVMNASMRRETPRSTLN